MAICPKINQCTKIQMVLDKELSLDELYAQAIKAICAKCKERDKN